MLGPWSRESALRLFLAVRCQRSCPHLAALTCKMGKIKSPCLLPGQAGEEGAPGKDTVRQPAGVSSSVAVLWLTA